MGDQSVGRARVMQIDLMRKSHWIVGLLLVLGVVLGEVEGAVILICYQLAGLMIGDGGVKASMGC